MSPRRDQAEGRVEGFTGRAFVSAWITIIEHYSRSGLTFPSDKLVAISGIARRFHQLFYPDQQPDYLAGHWRFDLLSQLLWHRGDSPGVPPVPRPSLYRAPSWSWTSLDVGVNTIIYPNPTAFKARVIEAKTTPLGDPFGQVSDGYIRVRCPLYEVAIDPGDRETLEDNVGVLNVKIETKGLLGWNVVAKWDDMSPSGLESLLNCRLFFFEIYHDNSTDVNELSGLLLKPTNAQRGQFTRVGVMYVILTDPDADRVVKESLHAKTVTEEFYEDFDGVDMYTIEIR